VAFTLDTHDQAYLSSQEGKQLPVEHCLRGSEGWQLYGRVADYCDDATPTFAKTTFGSVELCDYLRRQDFDEVELVGLVSNICVLSNAVLAKAALPNAEIAVDAACTAGPDPLLHGKALDVPEGIQVTVRNR
jgi:nicotinamidase-related amidase